ncbi:MAG: hypothetical protein M3327_02655 [Actinomycetota bacterium]|nr:hypothetical protein [Actinomycetota bacterium]
MRATADERAPRPRPVIAVLLVVAAALGSCTGDRDSGTTGEDGAGSGDVRRAPADLVRELRGWELTFLAVRGGRTPHLYLANADGSKIRRLDRLRGDKQTPNWSPDGRRARNPLGSWRL